MNAVVEFTAGKAIKAMASAMDHKWADSDGLAAYLRALKGIDPAWIERACDDWLQTDRFWPRPAQLRERAEALQRRRTAADAPAWVVPEMWTDPTTGETQHISSCRDCRGTGWIEAGPPKRDGIDPATLALYSSVRRCPCKRRSE